MMGKKLLDWVDIRTIEETSLAPEDVKRWRSKYWKMIINENLVVEDFVAECEI